jgi:formylglycine-generating enzyme required for sulfatase activity
MGTNNGDSIEKPVHEVCVDGYWMGKTEVTQGQWRKIMGSNPSHFKKGDNYPVEQVSWDDAQEYIKKLSSVNGKSFRLPTEAEWEYAARSGGKDEKYPGGNELNALAWYRGNSDGSPHPVAQKKPNGFQLYDMGGNLREWCQDRFDWHSYENSSRKNPQGPLSGSSRMLRGGSWINLAWDCRSTFREWNGPGYRYGDIGFRLVHPAGQ